MLVSYEQKGLIYILTIANPPVNVLTDGLLSEMDEIIDEILTKLDCRTLVVTGKGEKAFVAGADINQFLHLDAEKGARLVDRGKTEQIASKGPLAITKAKQAINEGLDSPLTEGQDFETQCFAALCQTEDMLEGAMAFKEKRVPTYYGK